MPAMRLPFCRAALAPELSAQLRAMIDPKSCGAVYPLSVAAGTQDGTVFTDGCAALIWHSCGFAFLCGDFDDAVLCEIGSMLLHPPQNARMILFAPDTRTAAHFSGEGFLQEQRLFFRYPKQLPPRKNHAVAEISAQNLLQIKGRITPAFSWETSEAFLQSGKGFCVMQEGMPAAWAFSAAVSDTETDIGVETDARFRRRGYAFSAAAAMIQYTIAQGKTPVWACHAENIASQKLAAALGFVPCGECTTIRRNDS